jgi:hypothetical protein
MTDGLLSPLDERPVLYSRDNDSVIVAYAGFVDMAIECHVITALRFAASWLESGGRS